MMTARTTAAFTGLCLIWGTSWMANSMLAGAVPPFRAAALRYGIAAAILFAWTMVRRRPATTTSGTIRSTMNGTALIPSVILGLTMIAIPFILSSWSGARISAGTTACIFAVTPMAAAWISTGVRNELLPRRGVYAAMAGIGTMAVAMSGAYSFSVSRAAALSVAVVAALSISASLVFAKHALRGQSLSLTAAVQLGTAAAVAATLSLFTERTETWLPWSYDTALPLLVLAVFGSALAVPLYYWLLRTMEPFQLATAEWIQPLIAVSAGAILLQRTPPGTYYLGLAGVLASCVVVLRSSTADDAPISIHVSAGHIQSSRADESP